MRRIFEWIGGFALIAFSFYFTDKVSLLVAEKSELMQEIKSVSSLYEENPVDALVDSNSNSITPGLYGKKVNDRESYLEMHDFGSFNENYLVFDLIKPKESLEDNMDKFITSGNPKKRMISLVLMPNEELEKYLDNSKTPYDLVSKTYIDTDDNVELINVAKLKDEFNTFTTKSSKKICLKDESNIELCKKNHYYLINPKINFSNTNLIETKNSLTSGSIILVSSGVKLENLKFLLKEIKFKDLSIEHISKLIDEES